MLPFSDSHTTKLNAWKSYNFDFLFIYERLKNLSLLVLSSQTYCTPMAMLIQISIVQFIFQQQFENIFIQLFNIIEMQLGENENGDPFGKNDKQKNLPERLSKQRLIIIKAYPNRNLCIHCIYSAMTNNVMVPNPCTGSP